MADKASIELYKIELVGLERFNKYLQKEHEKNKRIDQVGKWAITEIINSNKYRIDFLKESIAKIGGNNEY